MSKTNQKTRTVPMQPAIQRGDKQIDSVELRCPNAGELRGLSLFDLMRLDAASLCSLIPRISSPALTKEEMATLHPANLVNLGTAVTGFLLPEEQTELVAE